MLRDRSRSGVSRAALGGKADQGPSQRQRRVAEDIRHRLAELFARTEFRDPDLAGVRLTVAEVRMSPDLKHATVFVSHLGHADVDRLLPALKRVSPFLRGAVGQGMRTKFVPDLHFQPDHALDVATRINEILHSPDVVRDLGTSEKPDK
ncbi:30S ribosome-binding factor RbfA [Acidiphilium sp. AL]|uniref:Ribosome-binding factor A n=1 Tax=Acidiphilium iwatense TaxID=768198 RepID=A0ABS9DTP0_9PROT|nr:MULTISPECIES: 30S ribosome-binding factor RbfA [Acidiphilium]MCF3945513.1 30S ribosome-binding factor RbfA [Acidiphilium iwatense]MCU4159028.1 30S ribosome-binding factor RbfA [Acidiphilium sp. AL]